jgi:hypothetical protein
VKAFVDDRSPNAYEKVIDKLLQSPHYGENLGTALAGHRRLFRFVGDANDTEREAAWKYRDYVINAFNKNKPYDRFLLEQFAGDQLINYKPGASRSPKRSRSNGNGLPAHDADITDNQTIYQVDKYFDALEKATETSLKAVMGLQVRLCEVPRPQVRSDLQKDYYRLTSVFPGDLRSENWVPRTSFRRMAEPYGARHAPGRAEAWIKDVTSDKAKKYRREQLLPGRNI